LGAKYAPEIPIGDRSILVPGSEGKVEWCTEGRKVKRIRKRGKYERSSQFFLFFF
jgi:hypothetical protein